MRDGRELLCDFVARVPVTVMPKNSCMDFDRETIEALLYLREALREHRSGFGIIRISRHQCIDEIGRDTFQADVEGTRLRPLPVLTDQVSGNRKEIGFWMADHLLRAWNLKQRNI
jgi:hypothetical protein